MKWCTKDIILFNKEKEFVDTVVVPLVPISWDKNMTATVREGEHITILAREIEHQLMGRMVEAPPFTYLKSESMEERMKRLKLWEKNIKESGIGYIFYLTSDVDWNQKNHNMLDMIWLPAVPLEHMEGKARDAYLDETVQDILKVITESWQQFSE
ncbi:uncharacterized protein DUF2487 [Scopulibacillus darangshiensis]|uniref:Uncharacterized protein DUF2487 n=1 Tax=Scopulibacillus darangshiensis TaxID=442528 RepID=A0A4R2P9C9_9BACL|nr:DUF2487 family protein [Scopulibacillus darangshiensis]TCP31629.1 uncharacterized protein DUF2487 [Scopulibacillus darangshiensis]